GSAVRAAVDRQQISVGRSETAGADPEAVKGPRERMAAARSTPVVVSIDGAPVGLIGVADTIRIGSRSAVAELRRRGIEVVMLTGDEEATAREIARSAGIDEVVAGVRPAEKAAEIRRLR